jgi:prefoldin subunit 5
LRKKQLETLEKILQSKKNEIVHLTEKIGELETKISELKQEIGNDHNLDGK